MGERQAGKRYVVTLKVLDYGDDAFWRKHRGIEPEARLADYIKRLIDVGAAITKYEVATVEVERDD